MSDRFEDARGVIQDLFDGKAVAVTHITTLKGAIRGNHVHERTTQWTMVLTGELVMANGSNLLMPDGHNETVMGPGVIIMHRPGDPHAWKALEDTECLVFTKGPRSGENYETDVIRLDRPLLT